MKKYRAEQYVRWIEILNHGKINPRDLWKHLAKRRGKYIYEYKRNQKKELDNENTNYSKPGWHL